MNQRDPDQEILDEYERRRAEGTDLDGLERVTARVSSKARANFSIRLSRDEFNVILQAARRRGVTVTDFIREGAMSAAEDELAAIDPETLDLAEVGKELERLRKRVDSKLKAQAERPAS
ncbi:MAG: DUF1778 domain-containing protein [Dehalococcoidia bacterium]